MDRTDITIPSRRRLTPCAARELIESWEASGLSQRVFCDRRGIAVATFSYWRRRLRELAEVDTATESHPQLVAVRLKDPVGTSGGWTFRLVGGIELLPPEHLAIEDLAAMARALHAWKS